MPQVFISPDDLTKESFIVRGREAHHLIRVLRKKANDEIDIFNGKGAQYVGKLTALDSGKNEARGIIVKERKKDVRPHSIVLYQGLPQGSKFDFVIEKTTELGVDTIVPFFSKKSPIKLTPAQVDSKLSRWTRVAKAAAKQSNRSDVPVVEAPRELKDLEPHLKNGLTILLWEKEKEQPFKRVLRTAASSHHTINLIVGPESGFTTDEAAFFESCGAFSTTLGKRILRTETAGLVALSIVNYELGLF